MVNIVEGCILFLNGCEWLVVIGEFFVFKGFVG